MKFMNMFKSKEPSPKVDVRKEFQEQLHARAQEILNARPKACPYRSFAISLQEQFCDRALLEGGKFYF